MDTSYSNSDSLASRLHRRRREILFASVLTLAALLYSLASTQTLPDEAALSLTDQSQKLN